MSTEQFAFWLNGFAELTTEPPTPEQWKCIKEHLELVFKKETPTAPGTINIPMIKPFVKPDKPDLTFPSKTIYPPYMADPLVPPYTVTC